MYPPDIHLSPLDKFASIFSTVISIRSSASLIKSQQVLNIINASHLLGGLIPPLHPMPYLRSRVQLLPLVWISLMSAPESLFISTLVQHLLAPVSTMEARSICCWAPPFACGLPTVLEDFVGWESISQGERAFAPEGCPHGPGDCCRCVGGV